MIAGLATWGTFLTCQCLAKPKSGSQAVRDLIAEGISKAEDVIAEAKRRWDIVVSEQIFYSAKKKPGGGGKKKTLEGIRTLKAITDKIGLEETKELVATLKGLDNVDECLEIIEEFN